MHAPIKLYGIAGHPVGHSPSSAMHNAAFQAWGIPSAYLAWDVAPADLADFVKAVRLLPIAGASITLPHKQAIIPYLDQLSPQAQRVGAVNTLYFDQEGALTGHNSDVGGFVVPLFARPGLKRALILGAGGAARAALSGLLCLDGIEKVMVSARRREQAEELIATVKPVEDHQHDEHGIAVMRHSPKAEFLPWEERGGSGADLVVNATSLGLPGTPQADVSPLNEFSGQGLAYDLISYRTPFLNAAAAAGWESIDGKTMLLEQAKEQFILWTGFAMPDAAAKALDNFLDL